MACARAAPPSSGCQLGLLTILLIAGAGVGSLLLASEWAFNAVKIVGACYLIYLGISQWRSGAAPLATQESMPELSVRRRVLTGFLTNATNPKGIIFMVAVLPQFMTTSRPLWLQLLILAATIAGRGHHGHARLCGQRQCAARLHAQCTCGAQPEPGFRRTADGRGHRPVLCSARVQVTSTLD